MLRTALQPGTCLLETCSPQNGWGDAPLCPPTRPSGIWALGCPQGQRSVTSRPPSPASGPCTAVWRCRGTRSALCAPAAPGCDSTRRPCGRGRARLCAHAWGCAAELSRHSSAQHRTAQRRSAAPPARGSSGILRSRSHRVELRRPWTFPADAVPGTCAVTRCEDTGHRHPSLLPLCRPSRSQRCCPEAPAAPSGSAQGAGPFQPNHEEE